MNIRSTRPHPTPRRPRSRRSSRARHGVALVIVMIFLSLMLLLGLAITQLTTTEVSVSRNVNLSAEAFSVADAGAAHAYELVRNMRGDFTALLRGDDDVLKSGDEFADRDYRIYSNAGAITATGPERMFDLSRVRPIEQHGIHALGMIDGRHFYELIPYDNAGDARAYLEPADFEQTVDTSDRPNVDGDQRVLIRSIGYVTARETDPDDFDPSDKSNVIASAVVDVVIGLTPFPAVVSNGDLSITNTVTISGGLGGVHANDDLVLDAGGFAIEQSATFSDADTGAAPSGANQTADNPQVAGFNGAADPLLIPRLNPFRPEIARKADLVYLTPQSGAGNGASPNLRAALLAALGPSAETAVAGVDPTGVQAVVLRSNGAPNPTFSLVDAGAELTDEYDDVDLNVLADGSVSFEAVPTPVTGKTVFVLMPQGASDHVMLPDGLVGRISVITNGSVEIDTDAQLSSSLRLSLPEYPPWYWMDILAIAGEDVRVSGSGSVGDQLNGVIFAYEQFEVSGSGNIAGQIIGYEHALDFIDGAFVSHPTMTSRPGTPVFAGGSIISGNLSLTHEPGRGYVGNFAIASWRQLRDFDPMSAPRDP